MFQQVIAIGRLGRDPEKGDRGPCRFSIATTRSYTKDGEKVEETEWFSVSAWDKQGETCMRFLKKGRVCQVIGRLKTSEYTDKEGNTKRRVELIADRVVFLPDGGAKKSAADDDSSGDEPGSGAPDSGDDDIPF